jgi:hypothetical protein
MNFEEKEKKFIFKIINGVKYMSEDIVCELYIEKRKVREIITNSRASGRTKKCLLKELLGEEK